MKLSMPISDECLAQKLTEPAHHSEELRNVFVYANQRENENAGIAGWGHKFLRISIAECSKMMQLGTPCAGPNGFIENGVAVKFLERRDWARHPEVASLFREYVAAGAIDVNGLLPSSGVVVILKSGKALAAGIGAPSNQEVLPLELAIANGNVDAFKLFLEAGADPGLVPSRDWLNTENTRNNGIPLKDIFEVITAKVTSPALGPVMAAIVTEVMMNRRIQAMANLTSTPD